MFKENEREHEAVKPNRAFPESLTLGLYGVFRSNPKNGHCNCPKRKSAVSKLNNFRLQLFKKRMKEGKIYPFDRLIKGVHGETCLQALESSWQNRKSHQRQKDGVYMRPRANRCVPTSIIAYRWVWGGR